MLHEGVKVPCIIHVACIAENTLVQALAGNFFFYYFTCNASHLHYPNEAPKIQITFIIKHLTSYPLKVIKST